MKMNPLSDGSSYAGSRLGIRSESDRLMERRNSRHSSTSTLSAIPGQNFRQQFEDVEKSVNHAQLFSIALASRLSAAVTPSTAAAYSSDAADAESSQENGFVDKKTCYNYVKNAFDNLAMLALGYHIVWDPNSVDEAERSTAPAMFLFANIRSKAIVLYAFRHMYSILAGVKYSNFAEVAANGAGHTPVMLSDLQLFLRKPTRVFVLAEIAFVMESLPIQQIFLRSFKALDPERVQRISLVSQSDEAGTNSAPSAQQPTPPSQLFHPLVDIAANVSSQTPPPAAQSDSNVSDLTANVLASTFYPLQEILRSSGPDERMCIELVERCFCLFILCRLLQSPSGKFYIPELLPTLLQIPTEDSEPAAELSHRALFICFKNAASDFDAGETYLPLTPATVTGALQRIRNSMRNWDSFLKGPEYSEQVTQLKQAQWRKRLATSQSQQRHPKRTATDLPDNGPAAEGPGFATPMTGSNEPTIDVAELSQVIRRNRWMTGELFDNPRNPGPVTGDGTERRRNDNFWSDNPLEKGEFWAHRSSDKFVDLLLYRQDGEPLKPGRASLGLITEFQLMVMLLVQINPNVLKIHGSAVLEYLVVLLSFTTPHLNKQLFLGMLQRGATPPQNLMLLDTENQVELLDAQVKALAFLGFYLRGQPGPTLAESRISGIASIFFNFLKIAQFVSPPSLVLFPQDRRVFNLAFPLRVDNTLSCVYDRREILVALRSLIGTPQWKQVPPCGSLEASIDYVLLLGSDLASNLYLRPFAAQSRFEILTGLRNSEVQQRHLLQSLVQTRKWRAWLSDRQLAAPTPMSLVERNTLRRFVQLCCDNNVLFELAATDLDAYLQHCSSHLPKNTQTSDAALSPESQFTSSSQSLNGAATPISSEPLSNRGQTPSTPDTAVVVGATCWSGWTPEEIRHCVLTAVTVENLKHRLFFDATVALPQEKLPTSLLTGLVHSLTCDLMEPNGTPSFGLLTLRALVLVIEWLDTLVKSAATAATSLDAPSLANDELLFVVLRIITTVGAKLQEINLRLPFFVTSMESAAHTQDNGLTKFFYLSHQGRPQGAPSWNFSTDGLREVRSFVRSLCFCLKNALILYCSFDFVKENSPGHLKVRSSVGQAVYDVLQIAAVYGGLIHASFATYCQRNRPKQRSKTEEVLDADQLAGRAPDVANSIGGRIDEIVNMSCSSFAFYGSLYGNNSLAAAQLSIKGVCPALEPDLQAIHSHHDTKELLDVAAAILEAAVPRNIASGIICEHLEDWLALVDLDSSLFSFLQSLSQQQYTAPILFEALFPFVAANLDVIEDSVAQCCVRLPIHMGMVAEQILGTEDRMQRISRLKSSQLLCVDTGLSMAAAVAEFRNSPVYPRAILQPVPTSSSFSVLDLETTKSQLLQSASKMDESTNSYTSSGPKSGTVIKQYFTRRARRGQWLPENSEALLRSNDTGSQAVRTTDNSNQYLYMLPCNSLAELEYSSVNLEADSVIYDPENTIILATSRFSCKNFGSGSAGSVGAPARATVYEEMPLNYCAWPFPLSDTIIYPKSTANRTASWDAHCVAFDKKLCSSSGYNASLRMPPSGEHVAKSPELINSAKPVSNVARWPTASMFHKISAAPSRSDPRFCYAWTSTTASPFAHVNTADLRGPLCSGTDYALISGCIPGVDTLTHSASGAPRSTIAYSFSRVLKLALSVVTMEANENLLTTYQEAVRLIILVMAKRLVESSRPLEYCQLLRHIFRHLLTTPRNSGSRKRAQKTKETNGVIPPLWTKLLDEPTITKLLTFWSDALHSPLGPATRTAISEMSMALVNFLISTQRNNVGGQETRQLSAHHVHLAVPLLVDVFNQLPCAATTCHGNSIGGTASHTQSAPLNSQGGNTTLMELQVIALRLLDNLIDICSGSSDESFRLIVDGFANNSHPGREYDSLSPGMYALIRCIASSDSNQKHPSLFPFCVAQSQLPTVSTTLDGTALNFHASVPTAPGMANVLASLAAKILGKLGGSATDLLAERSLLPTIEKVNFSFGWFLSNAAIEAADIAPITPLSGWPYIEAAVETLRVQRDTSRWPQQAILGGPANVPFGRRALMKSLEYRSLVSQFDSPMFPYSSAFMVWPSNGKSKTDDIGAIAGGKFFGNAYSHPCPPWLFIEPDLFNLPPVVSVKSDFYRVCQGKKYGQLDLEAYSAETNLGGVWDYVAAEETLIVSPRQLERLVPLINRLSEGQLLQRWAAKHSILLLRHVLTELLGSSHLTNVSKSTLDVLSAAEKGGIAESELTMPAFFPHDLASTRKIVFAVTAGLLLGATHCDREVSEPARQSLLATVDIVAASLVQTHFASKTTLQFEASNASLSPLTFIDAFLHCLDLSPSRWAAGCLATKSLLHMVNVVVSVTDLPEIDTIVVKILDRLIFRMHNVENAGQASGTIMFLHSMLKMHCLEGQAPAVLRIAGSLRQRYTAVFNALYYAGTITTNPGGTLEFSRYGLGDLNHQEVLLLGLFGETVELLVQTKLADKPFDAPEIAESRKEVQHCVLRYAVPALFDKRQHIRMLNVAMFQTIPVEILLAALPLTEAPLADIEKWNVAEQHSTYRRKSESHVARQLSVGALDSRAKHSPNSLLKHLIDRVGFALFPDNGDATAALEVLASLVALNLPWTQAFLCKCVLLGCWVADLPPFFMAVPDAPAKSRECSQLLERLRASAFVLMKIVGERSATLTDSLPADCEELADFVGRLRLPATRYAVMDPRKLAAEAIRSCITMNDTGLLNPTVEFAYLLREPPLLPFVDTKYTPAESALMQNISPSAATNASDAISLLSRSLLVSRTVPSPLPADQLEAITQFISHIGSTDSLPPKYVTHLLQLTVSFGTVAPQLMTGSIIQVVLRLIDRVRTYLPATATFLLRGLSEDISEAAFPYRSFLTSTRRFLALWAAELLDLIFKGSSGLPTERSLGLISFFAVVSQDFCQFLLTKMADLTALLAAATSVQFAHRFLFDPAEDIQCAGSKPDSWISNSPSSAAVSIFNLIASVTRTCYTLPITILKPSHASSTTSSTDLEGNDQILNQKHQPLSPMKDCSIADGPVKDSSTGNGGIVDGPMKGGPILDGQSSRQKLSLLDDWLQHAGRYLSDEIRSDSYVPPLSQLSTVIKTKRNALKPFVNIVLDYLTLSLELHFRANGFFTVEEMFSRERTLHTDIARILDKGATVKDTQKICILPKTSSLSDSQRSRPLRISWTDHVAPNFAGTLVHDDVFSIIHEEIASDSCDIMATFFESSKNYDVNLFPVFDGLSGGRLVSELLKTRLKILIILAMLASVTSCRNYMPIRLKLNSWLEEKTLHDNSGASEKRFNRYAEQGLLLRWFFLAGLFNAKLPITAKQAIIGNLIIPILRHISTSTAQEVYDVSPAEFELFFHEIMHLAPSPRRQAFAGQPYIGIIDDVARYLAAGLSDQQPVAAAYSNDWSPFTFNEGDIRGDELLQVNSLQMLFLLSKCCPPITTLTIPKSPLGLRQELCYYAIRSESVIVRRWAYYYLAIAVSGPEHFRMLAGVTAPAKEEIPVMISIIANSCIAGELRPLDQAALQALLRSNAYYSGSIQKLPPTMYLIRSTLIPLVTHSLPDSSNIGPNNVHLLREVVLNNEKVFFEANPGIVDCLLISVLSRLSLNTANDARRLVLDLIAVLVCWTWRRRQLDGGNEASIEPSFSSATMSKTAANGRHSPLKRPINTSAMEVCLHHALKSAITSTADVSLLTRALGAFIRCLVLAPQSTIRYVSVMKVLTAGDRSSEHRSKEEISQGAAKRANQLRQSLTILILMDIAVTIQHPDVFIEQLPQLLMVLDPLWNSHATATISMLQRLVGKISQLIPPPTNPDLTVMASKEITSSTPPAEIFWIRIAHVILAGLANTADGMATTPFQWFTLSDWNAKQSAPQDPLVVLYTLLTHIKNAVGSVSVEPLLASRLLHAITAVDVHVSCCRKGAEAFATMDCSDDTADFTVSKQNEDENAASTTQYQYNRRFTEGTRCWLRFSFGEVILNALASSVTALIASAKATPAGNRYTSEIGRPVRLESSEGRVEFLVEMLRFAVAIFLFGGSESNTSTSSSSISSHNMSREHAISWDYHFQAVASKDLSTERQYRKTYETLALLGLLAELPSRLTYLNVGYTCLTLLGQLMCGPNYRPAAFHNSPLLRDFADIISPNSTPEPLEGAAYRVNFVPFQFTDWESRLPDSRVPLEPLDITAYDTADMADSCFAPEAANVNAADIDVNKSSNPSRLQPYGERSYLFLASSAPHATKWTKHWNRMVHSNIYSYVERSCWDVIYDFWAPPSPGIFTPLQAAELLHEWGPSFYFNGVPDLHIMYFDLVARLLESPSFTRDSEALMAASQSLVADQHRDADTSDNTGTTSRQIKDSAELGRDYVQTCYAKYGGYVGLWVADVPDFLGFLASKEADLWSHSSSWARPFEQLAPEEKRFIQRHAHFLNLANSLFQGCLSACPGIASCPSITDSFFRADCLRQFDDAFPDDPALRLLFLLRRPELRRFTTSPVSRVIAPLILAATAEMPRAVSLGNVALQWLIPSNTGQSVFGQSQDPLNEMQKNQDKSSALSALNRWIFRLDAAASALQKHCGSSATFINPVTHLTLLYTHLAEHLLVDLIPACWETLAPPQRILLAEAAMLELQTHQNEPHSVVGPVNCSESIVLSPPLIDDYSFVTQILDNLRDSRLRFANAAASYTGNEQHFLGHLPSLQDLSNRGNPQDIGQSTPFQPKLEVLQTQSEAQSISGDIQSQNQASQQTSLCQPVTIDNTMLKSGLLPCGVPCTFRAGICLEFPPVLRYAVTGIEGNSQAKVAMNVCRVAAKRLGENCANPLASVLLRGLAQCQQPPIFPAAALKYAAKKSRAWHPAIAFLESQAAYAAPNSTHAAPLPSSADAALQTVESLEALADLYSLLGDEDGSLGVRASRFKFGESRFLLANAAFQKWPKAQELLDFILQTFLDGTNPDTVVAREIQAAQTLALQPIVSGRGLNASAIAEPTNLQRTDYKEDVSCMLETSSLLSYNRESSLLQRPTSIVEQLSGPIHPQVTLEAFEKSLKNLDNPEQIEEMRLADPTVIGEMNFWARTWFRASSELNQWNALGDLSSVNSVLAINARAKLQDWATIEAAVSANDLSGVTPQSALGVLYASSAHYSAALAANTNDAAALQRISLAHLELREQLLAACQKLMVHDWRDLPSVPDAALLSKHLLHAQLQTEAAEGARCMAEITRHMLLNPQHTLVNRPDAVAQLTHGLMQTWRRRHLPKSATVQAWSDVLVWRSCFFGAIQSLSQRATDNDCKSAAGYQQDISGTVLTFSKAARKHGSLIDVPLALLSKLHSLPGLFSCPAYATDHLQALIECSKLARTDAQCLAVLNLLRAVDYSDVATANAAFKPVADCEEVSETLKARLQLSQANLLRRMSTVARSEGPNLILNATTGGAVPDLNAPMPDPVQWATGVSSVTFLEPQNEAAPIKNVDMVLNHINSALAICPTLAQAWWMWSTINSRMFEDITRVNHSALLATSTLDVATSSGASAAESADALAYAIAGLVGSLMTATLSSKRGFEALLRAFWLLLFDDEGTALARTFSRYSSAIPPSRWLPVLVHLFRGMDRPTLAIHFYRVLYDIIKHYPQAIFWNVCSSLEEVRSILHLAETSLRSKPSTTNATVFPDGPVKHPSLKYLVLQGEETKQWLLPQIQQEEIFQQLLMSAMSFSHTKAVAMQLYHLRRVILKACSPTLLDRAADLLRGIWLAAVDLLPLADVLLPKHLIWLFEKRFLPLLIAASRYSEADKMGRHMSISTAFRESEAASVRKLFGRFRADFGVKKGALDAGMVAEGTLGLLKLNSFVSTAKNWLDLFCNILYDTQDAKDMYIASLLNIDIQSLTDTSRHTARVPGSPGITVASLIPETETLFRHSTVSSRKLYSANGHVRSVPGSLYGLTAKHANLNALQHLRGTEAIRIWWQPGECTSSGIARRSGECSIPIRPVGSIVFDLANGVQEAFSLKFTTSFNAQWVALMDCYKHFFNEALARDKACRSRDLHIAYEPLIRLAPGVLLQPEVTASKRNHLGVAMTAPAMCEDPFRPADHLAIAKSGTSSCQRISLKEIFSRTNQFSSDTDLCLLAHRELLSSALNSGPTAARSSESSPVMGNRSRKEVENARIEAEPILSALFPSSLLKHYIERTYGSSSQALHSYRTRRLTHDLGAWSMATYFLGAGESIRPENVMFDLRRGNVTMRNITLRWKLNNPIPEADHMPFRMTRNLLDALGVIDGSLRFPAVLEAIREAFRNIQMSNSILLMVTMERYMTLMNSQKILTNALSQHLDPEMSIELLEAINLVPGTLDLTAEMNNILFVKDQAFDYGHPYSSWDSRNQPTMATAQRIATAASEESAAELNVTMQDAMQRSMWAVETRVIPPDARLKYVQASRVHKKQRFYGKFPKQSFKVFSVVQIRDRAERAAQRLLSRLQPHYESDDEGSSSSAQDLDSSASQDEERQRTASPNHDQPPELSLDSETRQDWPQTDPLRQANDLIALSVMKNTKMPPTWMPYM